LNSFIENDKKYIASTYNRFPLQIVEGKGSVCKDENGKEYIDLGTGIAVNTFGFCDEEWVNAVSKQLNSFQHTSNLYYSEPCATLAEILCNRTKLKKGMPIVQKMGVGINREDFGWVNYETAPGVYWGNAERKEYFESWLSYLEEAYIIESVKQYSNSSFVGT